MLDYSLDNLPERAMDARRKMPRLIEMWLELYAQLRRVRRDNGIVPTMICGPGLSGKDEVAGYLCRKAGLRRPQSSSFVAAPLVAAMAGSEDYRPIWEDRRNHREFWLKAMTALRVDDPALFARMCLGTGDMFVGARQKEEYESTIREKIVELVIWVERPGIPHDPTIEFGPELCDLIVPNYGTLDELYAKLDRVVVPLVTRFHK